MEHRAERRERGAGRIAYSVSCMVKFKNKQRFLAHGEYIALKILQKLAVGNINRLRLGDIEKPTGMILCHK